MEKAERRGSEHCAARASFSTIYSMMPQSLLTMQIWRNFRGSVMLHTVHAPSLPSHFTLLPFSLFLLYILLLLVYPYPTLKIYIMAPFCVHTKINTYTTQNHGLKSLTSRFTVFWVNHDTVLDNVMFSTSSKTQVQEGTCTSIK